MLGIESVGLACMQEAVWATGQLPERASSHAEEEVGRLRQEVAALELALRNAQVGFAGMLMSCSARAAGYPCTPFRNIMAVLPPGY